VSLEIQAPAAIHDDCKPSYAVGIVFPYNGVNIICRALGLRTENHNTNRCGIWSDGSFVMFLPKVERNITQQDQDAVRDHERGTRVRVGCRPLALSIGRSRELSVG
jgi:hypothetical protein